MANSFHHSGQGTDKCHRSEAEQHDPGSQHYQPGNRGQVDRVVGDAHDPDADADDGADEPEQHGNHAANTRPPAARNHAAVRVAPTTNPTRTTCHGRVPFDPTMTAKAILLEERATRRTRIVRPPCRAGWLRDLHRLRSARGGGRHGKLLLQVRRGAVTPLRWRRRRDRWRRVSSSGC